MHVEDLFTCQAGPWLATIIGLRDAILWYAAQWWLRR